MGPLVESGSAPQPQSIMAARARRSAQAALSGDGPLSSGSRDFSCESDYALGGGISGGVVREDGVAMSSAATGAASTTGNARTNCAAVTAAGAHGAMGWQPAGAHGNWHGNSDGADGISIPGIADVSDVAAAPGVPMLGIAQAKPPPTNTSCRRRIPEASPAIPRRRSMSGDEYSTWNVSRWSS